MILETIPAIGALTVDQKLRLVCEIWNDVSRQVEVPPGVSGLLDERLAEYEANPGAVRTTQEVTAGLMDLKQRLATAAK